jgi:hypothetical protein
MFAFSSPVMRYFSVNWIAVTAAFKIFKLIFINYKYDIYDIPYDRISFASN